ncbi:hypothetical protein PUN28_008881 [Cardiocondyla obscurior]|uniref:CHHC U11-48K-type domain-containing protein n=1 Tax=Cardiocondyla obscurior TaxID=286306 RepID=A0AAW2FUG7_9HYME
MDAYLLVTCPYNPAHRIAKYKFMNHVAKCKKSSKVANKTECPIDRTHIVDQAQLQEHIKSCSSLGKLAVIEYEKPKVDVNSSITNAYGLNENWDEEPEVPAYNPMEASSKKPVLRCITGLTKSEKKKFKEEERKRISMLKNISYESLIRPSTSSVTDTVDEVPLRLPRNPPSVNVSQNDLDESTEVNNYDSNDGKEETIHVPEYQNNLYQKLMYDELAPENDYYEQPKQINCNNDKHVDQEAKDFSVFTENQETKPKKIKTLDLFDNIERQKRDECIPSTSSGERVTDKLLALLKSESSMKKKQPKEEIPAKPDEKLPASHILSRMNERLTYLNGIQNAAAKESAQILKQLKELKLCEEIKNK